MDFNFITAEHKHLSIALQAVSDLFKKEFADTGTRLFSTQVLQNILPPKMVGAPPEISFLVIATIINLNGNVVPLSSLP